MACEPALSTHINSSTADVENVMNSPNEDGKERVDAAVPHAALGCEDIATSLPPTSSTNWLFNNDFPVNFTSFVTFLETLPAEGGGNNSRTYRNYSVIDIVRFFEAVMAKATSQRRSEWDASYRSDMAIQTGKYQKQAIESESRLEGKIKELSSSLESVSKELSDARAEVSSMKRRLSIAETKVQDQNKAFLKLQCLLGEEKARNNAAIKELENSLKYVNAKKMDREVNLRLSQDAGQAKDREVQRLASIIQEKENAIEEMQSTRNVLTSECQKLKDPIAALDLKSGQESLTSGSCADDHANPDMLKSACRRIDIETDKLVKFMYENSIMSKFPLKAPELQRFIGSISRARPGDFSRPGQVKHVWGHWICAKMFQGFDDLFFDMGEERTLPLDFKRHAVDCFLKFQEEKSIPSSVYFNQCVSFQRFCRSMYPLVFSSQVIDDALLLDSPKIVNCQNLSKMVDGDGELALLFIDVAKEIWLLHELAFSSVPPASILRLKYGDPFDAQLHEPLIKEAESKEMSSKTVVLMVRPGFRVKKDCIIKSRVFLSQKP